MKSFNTDTPVEDDIRQHFGRDLPTETEIEIVPHTRIWATAQGVLLWDPRNGYADILKTPDRYPRPRGNVVYISGGSLVARSALVNIIRNSVELDRQKSIGFIDLSREISKHLGLGQYETIVVTNGSTRPTAFDTNSALRTWCRGGKIPYLNINLNNF